MIDYGAVADAFAGAVPDTGWKRADCPLCLDRTGKPDRRKSMGLNTGTGGFNCHKCQATGRLREFALAEPPLVATAEEHLGVDPPEGFTPLWTGPGATAEATAQAREYLVLRGVTASAIWGCRIGACVAGYHQGRVVVPHGYQAKGKWIGWVARDVTGAAAMRYLYPRGMDRGPIWREAELSVDTTAPVLLCEGVFDALPHHPHAMAFLGKPIKAHVERLAAHRGRPLAVCLDGDAWDEAQALAAKLRFLGVPSVAAVRLPPGTDPGEADTAWLLRAARDALDDARR